MVKSLEEKLQDKLDKSDNKIKEFKSSEEYKLVKKLKKENLDYNAVMNLVKASKRHNPNNSSYYNIPSDYSRLLVFGDTHIGNKAYDPKIMNTMAKVAKEDNVDYILCTGDIADGWYQNRPASIFEQDAIGFENQLEKAVKEFGKLGDSGKPIIYITGNHEYNTFVRGAGAEFGDIFKLRLDKEGIKNEYLGNAEGDIRLGDKTKIKLLHPDGGSSYAISYKSQKIIESLQGSDGKLPDMALIGHFHKSEYIPYMGVQTFQTGTLCGQTKFMRGKGIPAHKGFWVLDVHSNKNGSISKIKPEFYSFK